MVKCLIFHNSSFAFRHFLMYMARPQCDTPLVCFVCLSHRDLPNHGISCWALDNIGKLLMSRGPLSWFHKVLTCAGEVIE